MRNPDAHHGVATWLHFAATPTFAAMALATSMTSHDPTRMLCQAMGHGALPLDGMTLMYLLMAAFHASPWWKWIALRRRGRTRKKRPWAAGPTAIESRRR